VRGNTAAIQAQTIQTAAALDQEFLVTVGADPVTAQTWATYLTAPDSLSEAQNLQGAFLFGSVVRRLENLYLQERLGAISDERQESRQALLQDITRSEGFSAFLDSLPAMLMTGEFREYMLEQRTGE
jgi:hypothetical protein